MTLGGSWLGESFLFPPTVGPPLAPPRPTSCTWEGTPRPLSLLHLKIDSCLPGLSLGAGSTDQPGWGAGTLEKEAQCRRGARTNVSAPRASRRGGGRVYGDQKERAQAEVLVKELRGGWGPVASSSSQPFLL